MTAGPAGQGGDATAAPQAISPAMIEEAAARIAGRARLTPVIDWSVRMDGRRVDVTLKLELLQHVGSFKPRGAFNRALSAAETPKLMVAASGGNHGLAVAFVGRELGIPAAVYVPRTAPQLKVDGIRALGAETVLVGGSYAEAAEASRERASEPGTLYVHAYDQVEVVAGQGTVGRELDQQVPGLGAVLVATGGGGLVGGIASWYGGRAQIISVEPHGSPTMYAALAAGEPVDVEVGGLASDALGPPGRAAWVSQRPGRQREGRPGQRRRHRPGPPAALGRPPPRRRARGRNRPGRPARRRLPAGPVRAGRRHHLRRQRRSLRPGGPVMRQGHPYCFSEPSRRPRTR